MNSNTLSYFTCNICGKPNSLPLNSYHREMAFCSHCHSNARFRGIIKALSVALFKESVCLQDFPTQKHVYGIGMSDAFYAKQLSEKFSYTNTFYNREPKLDILDQNDLSKYQNLDFVISTDVFEHIIQPVNRAFENVFKILKPGGHFIFSVPYVNAARTIEHFPNLYDFTITDFKGTKVLINRKENGELEVYENLIFHGGEGATLEMRVFGKAQLISLLYQTGFSEVLINDGTDLDIGYYWPSTPDPYNRKSLSQYSFEGHIFTIKK